MLILHSYLELSVVFPVFFVYIAATNVEQLQLLSLTGRSVYVFLVFCILVCKPLP